MDNTKSLKGIEQGRADYAYRCVEDAQKNFPNQNKKEPSKEAKEYKSYCKKIPMMIKINGLGNTIGFIKSKKGKVYSLLYRQISDYLYQEKPYLFVKPEIEPVTETLEAELLKQIIQLDTPEYRAITHELLALFSWMKRFSEGLIKDKEDSTEKEDAEG